MRWLSILMAALTLSAHHRRICDIEPTVENLQWGVVNLPTSGRAVIESHYATTSDQIPKDQTDKIAAHIARSCKYLKKIGVNCNNIYKHNYDKIWNGSGDNPGIGALYYRTHELPSDEQEMFQMNMYWKIAPPFPTKYLLTYKGRSVVVVAGSEVGPSSSKILMGVQPEVLYFLAAPNLTKVKIGRLKYQNIKPGPITCH